MPVFSCLCSYICSPLWSHFWPYLCQFSSIMLAIWRYFDISYCLPVLLLIILRSMHVQQYACLVLVVDHTRCMVFDYGKYIQQIVLYTEYTLSSIHCIYYVATFATASIVSKRLITPVIMMLPPCSSSLSSCSLFFFLFFLSFVFCMFKEESQRT